MAKRGGGGGEGEERIQGNGVTAAGAAAAAIVEGTTTTIGPKVGKGEKAAGAAHTNRRAEREPRGVRDGKRTDTVGAVGERPWHGERRGAKGKWPLF
eukprot:scaffold8697_cov113-Isochrysis_galbana.AAC.4